MITRSLSVITVAFVVFAPFIQACVWLKPLDLQLYRNPVTGKIIRRGIVGTNSPSCLIAQDKNLLAARKALAEAEKLRAEWKLASLNQAINRYKATVGYWRMIKNQSEEANTLKRIGEVYLLLGQNQKASEYFDQVLALSKLMADRLMEVEALNDIGEANIDLNHDSLVLDYCSKALEISKDIGYPRGRAQALSNLGLNSYVLSDLPKALNTLNEALTLWESLNDPQGQARVLLNLGYTYTDLGNIQEALSRYNRALLFWRAIKHVQGQAQTLTAMGLAYSSLGEMQKALDHHDQASEIFEMMGDRVGKATTLNARAYIYDTLGKKHKALALFENAMYLYRTLGRHSSEAITMGLIGEVYDSLGNKEKAIQYYNQKLGICRSIKDLRAEAYTLKDLGTVFDSQGDKDKALDYFNRALLLSKGLHDPRGEAYARNSIGYVYEALGQKQIALGFYNQALKLLNSVEDRAMEILALRNIARVMRDLGNLDDAYKYSKMLLDIVETVRAKVASQELRASYFASAYQHYELFIDVLMQLHKQNPMAGYDIAALEASEKARARSLIDLLNEAHANIRQGVDLALLRKEQIIQQSLKTKATRQVQLLSDRHDEKQAAVIEQEISDLTDQYEEVQAQIRAHSPRYAVLTQLQTANLSAIQRDILDADTMLLEYSLGDERSYLWAVTPNSIASFELPARRKIEDTAKRLYRLLSSPLQMHIDEDGQKGRASTEDYYSETATQLSQMLLQPIAQLLKGKRLILVADGALQYLPFGALPEPGSRDQNRNGLQPLVLTHELISLPSISTLGVLRKEITGRSLAPKDIAVLADPVFEKDDPRVYHKAKIARGKSASRSRDPDKSRSQVLLRSAEESGAVKESYRFPRLPYAYQEAKAILSLVSPDQYKLAKGFEANYSLATSSELAQYRIVHFATHGLLNPVHPQLSGIVLSLVDEQGNSQDGFLRLNDIYNLKLSAELVVLSACQTALGKEIKGEGLGGITRGFIFAGAARVVASLWKVDDRATAELMRLFYNGLLGPQRLRPAAALKAAQVAMWQQPRWNSPFYWAAFILQGEWK
jgi:CHAT domain-containing protein/tetratricopeptide (TPR) repeat protein